MQRQPTSLTRLGRLTAWLTLGVLGAPSLVAILRGLVAAYRTLVALGPTEQTRWVAAFMAAF